MVAIDSGPVKTIYTFTSGMWSQHAEIRCFKEYTVKQKYVHSPKQTYLKRSFFLQTNTLCEALKFNYKIVWETKV